MHDFCLTIPYGAMLIAGGVMGYVKANSIMSLATGGGIGIAMLIVAVSSYNDYQACANENRKGVSNSKGNFQSATYSYWVWSAVLSMLTFAITGDRFMKDTSKPMPMGYVAGVSLLLTLWLANKIFFSGDVGSSAKRGNEGGKYENTYVNADKSD